MARNHRLIGTGNVGEAFRVSGFDTVLEVDPDADSALVRLA